MIDVNKLLKKKKLTGQEVGQIAIAGLMYEIKGKGQNGLLVNQDTINSLINSLKTEKDVKDYNIYYALYTGVIDSFNRGQGLYQQFYNGFDRLLMALKEVQDTEDAKRQLEQQPIIMTQSQYDRIEKECIEKSKAFKVSYSQLVLELLQDFLENEEREDKLEVPEAIERELEALKEVPANKNRYTELYNSTYGLGYYTLEDGTRSDSMTSEEWQAKLLSLRTSKYKYYVDGVLQGQEETLRRLNTDRRVKLYELFFKGAEDTREAYLNTTGEELDGTDEDILKALEDVLGGYSYPESLTKTQLEEAFNYKIHTEWHLNEEPPAELTQLDLLDIYIEQFLHEGEDEKEVFKDFKADYPALYKALTDYIEEVVPTLKGLKANQLYKEIISWGELAELNIGRYKELIEPSEAEITQAFKEGIEDDTTRYNYHMRSINGIAILKNPRLAQVDANGDYKEEFNPLYSFTSLDSLEMNPDKLEEIQGLKNNLIYPALSCLYAINAMFKILGEIYSVQELPEVASFDMGLFESKINGYNGLLYSFYYDVYARGEELEEKRRQIKEFFPIIDYEYIKPTKEEIQEIKEEIEAIAFNDTVKHKLKFMDGYIDRLRVRGLTYDK